MIHTSWSIPRCGALTAILFTLATLPLLWSVGAGPRLSELAPVPQLSWEPSRRAGVHARASLLSNFHFATSIFPLLRQWQLELRFPPPAKSNLTVHEWGTFTSIAGPDGVALDWLPLTGSTELPSFVEHLENANFKGGLRGTVRMETPVLYFYSSEETTVSVHATFSKGLITEWYPHASVPAIDPRRDSVLGQKQTTGVIHWDSVQIEPAAPANFPGSSSANHYYAARQTASAPLTVGSSAGPQHEKFLFYRGVSAILPPLTATLSPDGTVWLESQLSTVSPGGSARSAGLHAAGLGPHESQHISEEIPNVILFERRGSRVGYRILGPLSDQASFALPTLDGSLTSLSSALRGMLIGGGLYADEAQAMLETWESSWFEEGSRVLYLVPRAFVDSVLPLTITPAPASLTRVFVGRIELITPATQHAVASAFATNDRATLLKYSRFLDSILGVMRQTASEQSTRDLLDTYRDAAFSIVYSAAHSGMSKSRH